MFYFSTEFSRKGKPEPKLEKINVQKKIENFDGVALESREIRVSLDRCWIVLGCSQF